MPWQSQSNILNFCTSLRVHCSRFLWYKHSYQDRFWVTNSVPLNEKAGRDAHDGLLKASISGLLPYTTVLGVPLLGNARRSRLAQEVLRYVFLVLGVGGSMTVWCCFCPRGLCGIRLWMGSGWAPCGTSPDLLSLIRMIFSWKHFFGKNQLAKNLHLRF